ncbi:MAG: DUF2808 domain-containing protein [Hydrococcus sp. Prado102]|jgi:hypothetical protein|nr:DUF2808 domain-containing protein [Hydrococcus sp. Prado102]
MKKLVSIGLSLSLAIIFFAPVAQATSVRSGARPSSATVQGATHFFEYYVRNNALSELSIEMPEGIKIRNGIEVKNSSGQELDAQVSINGRKATVAFSQPIPPDTKIAVSMRGVYTPGYDGIWQYRLFGKLVGIDQEIPLGFARIHTYF